MKISQLFPSKYVRAADLNGKTVTLTISNLVTEELGHGNEKETKPVLYFQKATKGLVLNATNARAIAALYGDESEGWAGKRVSIYPTRVKAFGQTHEVIRVREEIPAQPKPATQASTPVEENEIDDMEDVADMDEGHVGPPPDDDLWEPETPPRASAKQLEQLDAVGVAFYGEEEWKTQLGKLVEAVTTGASKSARELTPEEATKLTKGIERKKAAVAQSTDAAAA